MFFSTGSTLIRDGAPLPLKVNVPETRDDVHSSHTFRALKWIPITYDISGGNEKDAKPPTATLIGWKSSMVTTHSGGFCWKVVDSDG